MTPELSSALTNLINFITTYYLIVAVLGIIIFFVAVALMLRMWSDLSGR